MKINYKELWTYSISTFGPILALSNQTDTSVLNFYNMCIECIDISQLTNKIKPQILCTPAQAYAGSVFHDSLS